MEFLDSDGYTAWANGEEYTPLLTGSDVKGAQAYTDTSSNSSSSFGVQLTFTDEGSTKFAEATKANLNKIIYIVYDGEVKSAPLYSQKSQAEQHPLPIWNLMNQPTHWQLS